MKQNKKFKDWVKLTKELVRENNDISTIVIEYGLYLIDNINVTSGCNITIRDEYCKTLLDNVYMIEENEE